MVRHVIKWTFVALLVIGICCGGDIAVTKTSVSQNGVIGNIQGAEAGSSHVLGAVQVVGSSAPVAPATVASATVATVAAPLPVSPSSPSTTGNTLISAPSKTTIPTQQIQPVHPNEKPTT